MREDLRKHSPFGELVGTKVLGFDEASGELRLEYEARPEFTNRIGTLAGGIVSALLDSITGLAAMASLPEGVFAVHTSLKVEYLRPGKLGTIGAVGRVTESSDRDIRSVGELRNADGERIARGEASLRILKRARD